ncbi:hypothetical protein, partial [Rhodopseudomonas palustris]|uniref:hypothetical protein n=1 Tax=Rhodopseudomonas palustris TaxID=1076 RepID=UPI001AEC0113
SPARRKHSRQAFVKPVVMRSRFALKLVTSHPECRSLVSSCGHAPGDAACRLQMLSLVSDTLTIERPLKKFGTAQPAPYCYELQSDHRLESVANMHTAADLHAHPRVSNRAGLKSRGRRERAKKYTTPSVSQRN